MFVEPIDIKCKFPKFSSLGATAYAIQGVQINRRCKYLRKPFNIITLAYYRILLNI